MLDFYISVLFHLRDWEYPEVRIESTHESLLNKASLCSVLCSTVFVSVLCDPLLLLASLALF